MARARIGKLYHLTPLVDDLPAAEYFFNSVFTPLCWMRNYSPHFHRDAAMYVIADTSIEVMRAMPPGDCDQPTSWYRYAERYGPRVHSMAFYVDDVPTIDRQLQAAGVRTTDGGMPDVLFTHPKDTPGMLEFFNVNHPGSYEMDPRLRPEWAPIRDAFWPNHRLGLCRLSHVTVVVHDATAAEKFYVDVLDAVPLPDQAATLAGSTSRYVAVGEDTVLELLSPDDADSRAARELAHAGESVIAATFTIRDVASALDWLARTEAPVATSTEHEVLFDVDRTWGCEYRLTDRVLAGDPRVERE